MTQNIEGQAVFYPDAKTQAVFTEHGPQPQFLLNDPRLKVIVAGLEAGQAIPVHPESLAVYYFLTGTGTMTVADEQYPIAPGTTIITPEGARRGMQAETRVIFLAAKPA